jgi:putative ABC transport system permease protein
VTDLAQGVRRLRTAPAIAGAVAFTICGATAAVTLVITLTYGVLLKPLPFPDADRLVVGYQYDSSGEQRTISFPEFGYWRAHGDIFEGIAAATWDEVDIAVGSTRYRVRQAVVTYDFFSVLGVTPLTGRLFDPTDEAHGRPVLILSESIWRRSFGADP